MPYATPTDFIAIFGERETLEITNLDTPTAALPNLTILTRELSAADDEINTYLCVDYQVPIVPTPPILTRISCIIARKILDRYRRRDDIQNDYKEAIEWLKLLVAHKVGLSDPTGKPVLPSDKGKASVGGFVSFGEDRGRVFTEDSLSWYQRQVPRRYGNGKPSYYD